MLQLRLFTVVLDVCIVACIVGMFIATRAWSACPDMTVRPNSPCKTNNIALCVPTGPPGGGVHCPASGETVASGNFQCDMPKPDVTCTGAGTQSIAPCNTVCSCTVSGQTCVLVVPCQTFGAEQLKEVACPGT